MYADKYTHRTRAVSCALARARESVCVRERTGAVSCAIAFITHVCVCIGMYVYMFASVCMYVCAGMNVCT
jgi:hypothetical protein